MIFTKINNMINADINKDSNSIYLEPCENSFELEQANKELKQSIFDEKLKYTKISNDLETNFTSRNINHYHSNLNKSIFEDCEENINVLKIENNINLENNINQKRNSKYSLNKKVK